VQKSFERLNLPGDRERGSGNGGLAGSQRGGGGFVGWSRTRARDNPGTGLRTTAVAGIVELEVGPGLAERNARGPNLDEMEEARDRCGGPRGERQARTKQKKQTPLETAARVVAAPRFSVPRAAQAAQETADAS